MGDILGIAEAGLRSGLQQIDVISNNIANSNTQGYKREIRLQRAFEQYLPSGPLDVPQLAASARDHSAGALQYTGSSLNLALEGDGYFQLQSPHGILLTRAGQFRIDAYGQLVSVQGWPVLLSGAASFDSANLIAESDGALVAGGEWRAQIELVSVDPALLEPAGPGLFRSAATTPVAKGSVTVRQGYLEGSNVDPLGEMVDLIMLTRQIQSTQQLIRAYDEVLGSAITNLGEY